MNRRWTTLLACLALIFSASTAFAQSERFDTARRHMLRGSAALEMAKSKEDLSAAAKEFSKAVEIAPSMADAWYNLGAVQVRLEQYAEAITSFRKYLELNPKAPDAQKVRDQIVKLEYRQERLAEERAPGWTRLVNSDSETYIDKSTIQVVGHERVIWTVTNEAAPNKFKGEEFNSVKWQYLFNCNTKKYRYVAGGLYSGRLAEGHAVATFTPSPEAVWQEFSANSPLLKLFESLCEK